MVQQFYIFVNYLNKYLYKLNNTYYIYFNIKYKFYKICFIILLIKLFLLII